VSPATTSPWLEMVASVIPPPRSWPTPAAVMIRAQAARGSVVADSIGAEPFPTRVRDGQRALGEELPSQKRAADRRAGTRRRRRPRRFSFQDFAQTDIRRLDELHPVTLETPNRYRPGAQVS
jgi:hypothetical protein